MIKHFKLFVFAIFFCFFNLPAIAISDIQSHDIDAFYFKNDYEMVAKLLEQQIKQRQDKEAADNKTINFDNYELYRLHLFLAHTYAWKLNRFDSAIAEYQKANNRNHAQMQIARAEMAKRQMPEQQMNMPAFEFLFIGGMYEQKKDYHKALEYYQKILPEAQSSNDNASDSEIVMVGQDVIFLVQNIIDGIQLKLKPAKEYKPLLKTINLLYSGNSQLFSFMMSNLLPDMEYAGSLAEKKGLQAFIKTNPANIHSMLLEYIIVSNVAAGSMSPDVQSALEAFLAKYPDSYFSLLLRHQMARYYKENGENNKAKRYMKELQEFARRRNIELITEPDKKFATPEATWEYYRKALCAGDMKGAISCHIPGDTKYREVFTKLGPETIKKIGNDMRSIEKITADASKAKYRIKRLIEGKEITFYVYFVNINGEWKIEQY